MVPRRSSALASKYSSSGFSSTASLTTGTSGARESHPATLSALAMRCKRTWAFQNVSNDAQALAVNPSRLVVQGDALPLVKIAPIDDDPVEVLEERRPGQDLFLDGTRTTQREGSQPRPRPRDLVGNLDDRRLPDPHVEDADVAPRDRRRRVTAQRPRINAFRREPFGVPLGRVDR